MDALVPEPVVETGIAEAGVIRGEKGVFARGDAEVARVGVGDDLARIVALLQYRTDELVEAELFGSRDLHDAAHRRANDDPGKCARDVIRGHGLDRADASRTVLPWVASSAMPLMNSKNCVAWTIE